MNETQTRARESFSLGSLAWFTAGAVAGSVAMFFLDPSAGRRRRARVRDKAVRFGNEADYLGRKFARNLSHRAMGLAAKMTHTVREVDDETLHERVRSAFGHRVQHARSIEVDVKRGVITLRGPILADEVEGVLDCVEKIEGVREVVNALEVRDYLQ